MDLREKSLEVDETILRYILNYLSNGSRIRNKLKIYL